jgi:N-acetylmuramoyl-L-alanine amidase
MAKRCWIIDPGHGPKTRGRRSPKLPDGRRFAEYLFTHAVAWELCDLCMNAGMEYGLTVDPDDPTVGNSIPRRLAFERLTRSNNPKVFVSIHSNASPVKNETTDWGPGHGIETWHFFTPKNKEHTGVKIAAILQRHLVKALGLKDRGLKFTDDRKTDPKTGRKYRQFAVLAKTLCPAVLVEIGFWNNQKEVEFLLAEDTPRRAALAMFAAFQEIEKNL